MFACWLVGFEVIRGLVLVVGRSVSVSAKVGLSGTVSVRTACVCVRTRVRARLSCVLSMVVCLIVCLLARLLFV